MENDIMNDTLFDHTVSNPPYQLIVKKSDKNANVCVDIYPSFHRHAHCISRNTTMIYPASWQNDITAKHGKWLMDNGMFRSTNFDANSVFGKSIHRGFIVSIVSSSCSDTPYVLSEDDIHERNIPVWINNIGSHIVYKRTQGWLQGFLHGVSPMTDFVNIETSDVCFYDSPDDIDDPMKVYIKKRPGKQADASFYYANHSDVIKHVAEKSRHFEFGSYNVVARSSVLGRMPIFYRTLRDKGFIPFTVFCPDEVSSNTLQSVKSFETAEEAHNFRNYMQTHFVSLLLRIDFTRRGFACYVPDLQDYTDSHPSIDWSKPLDDQLYRLFNLSSEEIFAVESCRL